MCRTRYTTDSTGPSLDGIRWAKSAELIRTRGTTGPSLDGIHWAKSAELIRTRGTTGPSLDGIHWAKSAELIRTRGTTGPSLDGIHWAKSAELILQCCEQRKIVEDSQRQSRYEVVVKSPALSIPQNTEYS